MRKRAQTTTGIKGRWKSMRSKERYNNVSGDIPEDGDAEEEVLLRRVNAGKWSTNI